MRDAFVSYNRADAAEVDAVVTQLKALGAAEPALWYDTSLDPGDVWFQHVEAGLQSCKSTVVFIGTRGLGPIQEREIGVAMSLNAARRSTDAPHKVVPVLLPGADARALPALVSAIEHYVTLANCHDLLAIGAIYRAIIGADPLASRDARAGEPPYQPFEARDLVTALASTQSILYLVGPSGGGAGRGAEADRLAPWQLSRHFLSRLKLVQPEDEILPSVDLASHYFALAEDDPSLEAAAREFVRHNDHVPPTQDALARWIECCVSGKRKTQHVIVTTNVDLEIERALLVAGVPFTRYILDHIQRTLLVQQHPATRDCSYRTDPTPFLEAAALSRYEFAETDPSRPDYRRLTYDQPVVLYKLLGSIDQEGSPIRTAERHLELFARKAFDAVPDSIRTSAKLRFVFVVGYSMLDAEYRVISHVFGLNEKSVRKGLRHFVRARPRGDDDTPTRFERRLWDGFARSLGEGSINAIDELPSVFFSSLTQGLTRLGSR